MAFSLLLNDQSGFFFPGPSVTSICYASVVLSFDPLIAASSLPEQSCPWSGGGLLQCLLRGLGEGGEGGPGDWDLLVDWETHSLVRSPVYTVSSVSQLPHPSPPESPQGDGQPGLVTVKRVGRTGNKERKGAATLEGPP